ncbi:MAG: heme lyase CcmF/NrfE family subunit [Alphaproteobacteria bacterium]|nr:heme lyase CcmF/NrfE family subunit [Alphaproteobacteria bacterium]GIT35661.1 MAG: cytochrome c-type biogenesis protein CcmF [Pelagibacterales bacterium]|tara:strand:- start:978 stop:2849 length:1872 start_codon:yes stop_codon:yes gene_type:complete
MINQLGNYSLYIALLISIFVISKTSLSLRKSSITLSGNIFSLISVQSIMVIISFLTLIYAFVTSDFSNETVYNNSHTTKPLFYKISGTWGNHEGSLLLWLLVLTIFLFIFTVESKNLSQRYRTLTLFFQQIIIFGFLLFILFTSNPFSNLFPIPNEGTGLNPILQDPALAIHPPILYLGYVGTSIIFSSALAAIISGSINKSWASHIKKWVLVSWVFLSIGILLGSIWAYYELGWGGFWFWDPVENVSLMPWLCLTALLHTIFTLEKRDIFHSWAVILSITTFSLSMSGTFLVRSGILNSIHTFANDPSRGVFILCFLFILIFLSILIYFFYQKTIKENLTKPYLISKETAVLLNNLFMMFFLSVVLIGTVYPIFLEVINNEKISIGPPFYHKLLIPFLIPFLFFMAIGPNIKWINDKIGKINFTQVSIFIISIIVSYFFVKKYGVSYLLSLPLFILSIFLFFITIKDFFGKKVNISQKISHFGFSLLILSILLNGVLSKEFSSNMKVGDERKFLNKTIKFESIKVIKEQNYQSLIGEFNIKDENNSLSLKPELRIYDQPQTITSEADISSTIFSDNFLVFNVLKNDGFYNVRYQIKPFMIWIWISVILISFGGLISLKKKNV